MASANGSHGDPASSDGQPATAPWRTVSAGSRISRLAFAPRWKPSPSHVGHHPSGLLNE